MSIALQQKETADARHPNSTDTASSRTGSCAACCAEQSPIIFAPQSTPRLIVSVDTEEEFDWDAPFDPRNIGVGHMEKIGRFQEIFDHFGLKPVYVIDYPIASQEQGYGLLRDYSAAGRAVIGAHLHPWVTPPIEENICAVNSYPGNLPRAQESAKLETLTARIERSFGFSPTIYKAGRYGCGPNTFSLLKEHGYEIDNSPAPPMDFTFDGGPDFRHQGAAPFWADRQQRLLCIPHTGAFTGLLHRHGPDLYPKLSTKNLRWAHLPAFASRLRLIDRLRLSPEGHTVNEMKRLTRWLYDRGQRLFVFSMHSTSVEPGNTPYVRTERDLEIMLAKFWRYFEFFFSEMKGEATTPHAVKSELEAFTKRKKK